LNHLLLLCKQIFLPKPVFTLHTYIHTFNLPGNIIRSEERDHPQWAPATRHVHSSHHVTRNFRKHLLW